MSEYNHGGSRLFESRMHLRSNPIAAANRRPAGQSDGSGTFQNARNEVRNEESEKGRVSSVE